MDHLEKDAPWRGISSFIKGLIGGFWIGAIIGVIIWSVYLIEVKKADVSGEESLALVLGAIPGALIGAIAGAIFSYLKRNNRRWRIFFLIIFCLPLLQLAYGLLSNLFYRVNITF